MNGINTLSHVRSLLAEGQAVEAAEALVREAHIGSSPALHELALWLVSGDIVPRDLPAAYEWLGRAQEAGSDDAALLRAYFTATGTGCSANWQKAWELLASLAKTNDVARQQIGLLEKMKLATDGAPTKSYDLTPCSNQPKVATCRGFLTAIECDYLVRTGAPFLQPSYVVDPQTCKLIPHPVRKSYGAMFGVYTEDLVVNAINRRIASISGTAFEQGEPLQLLQYQRGDEYRAHLDALPNEPNQRVLTVIIYLSDDYDGGETRFLRTGLSFRGLSGDALLFANVLPDGRPDQLSLHCGTPVTRGTKTIATRWIRGSHFTYPPPRPVLDRLPEFAA